MSNTKSGQSNEKNTGAVKLPVDFFPACWQDDERMDNLFAPFRAKSVNPVNWESKMKFWKNLIKEYCQWKGSSVVLVIELRDALKRNEKKPHCLDTVFEHLMNEGSIQRKDQFLQPPQHSWSEWAIHKLIKSPFQWGFDRVKERVVATNNSAIDSERIQVVVTEVVKSHAEKLLNSFNASNDCLTVIAVDDLIKQFSSNEMTAEGVEMALHSLHCQQKASIHKTQIDQKPVILCKLSVDMNCKAEPITPVDVSIYTLNKMEKSLAKSVEGIENDIEQTDTLVRQYIREKKKQLAKSFLRKKHVLEKNLTKTSNSLTTVQTLLLQIDETKHNAKIVEAFKMGTKTLKNALDDKNITVDNVDDALADVKEILETNADIQFALSGAQFNDILNDGVDEESLESELMDLLEEDNTSGTSTPKAQEPTQPKVEPATVKPSSPSTITNVIDDLLEDRLKKLRLENTINVSIGNGQPSQNTQTVAHASKH